MKSESARDVKKVFGGAVREVRSELGISQEELAERAGLHRTYISDVERGVRNLSLENIEKLGQALEVSIQALFQRASGIGGAAQHVEILLIEDDRRDVELTLRAFRKVNITNVVHVVRDGAEALDFLFCTGSHQNRTNQPLPGVILLDLNLPKVSGLEVLRKIKADARLRKIPLIVLTVSSRERDIAECRRLGAASYIVKPVGFQNFSEVTPHLQMGWALVKTEGGAADETKTG
jgi:CheY-like chemotaxis protein/DNA-binding Xre family transcriptional regulator